MNTNSQNISHQAGQVQGQAQVVINRLPHSESPVEEHFLGFPLAPFRQYHRITYSSRSNLIAKKSVNCFARNSQYHRFYYPYHKLLHMQEKTSQMMGGVSSTAQSLKESCQEVSNDLLSVELLTKS